MAPLLLRLATLLLAALSLGASWAHVLEMPVRLGWSAELWMATTNFGGLYALFGRVGAVVDVGAILAAGATAAAMRRDPEARGWGVAGAVLLVAGLVAWAGLVAPMNAVMAGWTPGPPPDGFEAVRLRWEVGHAVVAALKVAGLSVLVVAALREARPPSTPRCAGRSDVIGSQS